MDGDFTIKFSQRKCRAVTVDQALEIEHNKDAKGRGDVIGFKKHKDLVARWNIIKHQKIQNFTFLHVCNISCGSEYSFHHRIVTFQDLKIY